MVYNSIMYILFGLFLLKPKKTVILHFSIFSFIRMFIRNVILFKSFFYGKINITLQRLHQ